jgi:UDP-N-acetyl-D-mannosaminuronate dehydrogenase
MSLKGSKVLVLGLHTRPTSTTLRESPSLELIELFKKKREGRLQRSVQSRNTAQAREYDLRMKASR